MLLQQKDPNKSQLWKVRSITSAVPSDLSDNAGQPNVEVVSSESRTAGFGHREQKQSVKKRKAPKRVKNNELSMSVKSSISSYEDAKFA